MSIPALVCGLLVFLAALIEKIPLTDWIFGNAVGLVSISAAGLSLILLWYLLHSQEQSSSGYLPVSRLP